MVPQIVTDNLSKLSKDKITFENIYNVLKDAFEKETFAESYRNGIIEKTSYLELYKKVDEVSAALVGKLADKTSGVVGLYMENSVAWVACFWGILQAGYEPLLLNAKQDLTVTNSIIDSVSPILVISDEKGIYGAVSYLELLEDSGKGSVPTHCWADAILLVTSGSTAMPKIIRHTGAGIGSQVMLTADLLERNITIRHNRALDVHILAFLPFYHIFGLVSTLLWFTLFGRTLVFLPDYSVSAIQDTCKTVGVTHFFSIPMVWDRVCDKLLLEVEGRGQTKTFMKLIHFSNKLQSVMPNVGPWIVRNVFFKKIREQLLGTNCNFLIAGGGFIAEKTLEVMNGIGYSLYVGYGLTECGILSVNLSRKASQRLHQTCGPVFYNVKYRQNEEGVLEIARENCFVGQYIDGEYVPNNSEWYSTNDIVEFKNGELYCVGRVDDVIIGDNGENISPESVEARIAHGSYESASLLYVNIQGKKQLMLALSAGDGFNVDERVKSLEQIYRSIDALPMLERPAIIAEIAGRVPYTLKAVDRKKLASQIESGHTYYSPVNRSGAVMDRQKYDSEEYRQILDYMKKAFAKACDIDENAVNDTSDFASLGGDSLKYLDMLVVVSQDLDIELGVSETPLLSPVGFANYIYEMKNKEDELD